MSMPVATKRAGLQQAAETFIKWTSWDGDHGVGSQLVLDFMDFVIPGKDLASPLDVQSEGALVHMTEHELAKLIMGVFDNGTNHGGDIVTVDKVVVNRIVYKDISLDRVEITGWDEDFMHVVLAGMQGPLVHEHDAGPGDPRLGAADGPDFLSLLDKSVSKQKRAGRASKGGSSSKKARLPVVHRADNTRVCERDGPAH